MMDLAQFKRSLGDSVPPPDLNMALRALWFDTNGRDESAARAATANSIACGRVRAYLHRKAGDEHATRVAYWRCGETVPTGSLAAEWDQLVQIFLVEIVVAMAYL